MSRTSLRAYSLSSIIALVLVAHPTGQPSAPGFPAATGLITGPTGTLGIDPTGVFTIKLPGQSVGQRKFLLFFSYFGGLRDAVQNPSWLADIFHSAKQYGFHGVRVFPLWWEAVPR